MEDSLQGETTRLISRRKLKDVKNSSAGTQKRMNYLLVVVVLERLTYYSIVANLLLYFKYDIYKDYNTKSGNTAAPLKTVFGLLGLSWLMCVFGGWISDIKLGKRQSLLVGLIFYTIGMALLFGAVVLLGRVQLSLPYRVLIVCGSIMVLLIGEGAYKANVSPFGAEQMVKEHESNTRRFFNYYYCCINMGAFFAYTVVAYLQQNRGFIIGFAIPLGSITLALLIFMSQHNSYEEQETPRILGKVFQIMKEARRKRRKIEKSTSKSNTDLLKPKIPWLDHAKLKNGGSFLDWEVEDVKLLLKVMPVFLLLIPYWMIYSQVQATFLDQGIHMRFLKFDSFSMPAAWLNIFNVVIVVTLIPIMENFVYPALTKRGYQNSPLGRITVGTLIACLSIIAAGFVELYVVDDLKHGRVINQTIDTKNTTASTMWVFWQIPQYTLVSLSEVFAVVAGLEFAYRNAPKSMQSIVMALYFMTNSLGYILGLALLTISEKCHVISSIKYPDYSDHTFYFFLLCVVMFVAWVVFMLYMKHSSYTDGDSRHIQRLRSNIYKRKSVNIRETQNNIT